MPSAFLILMIFGSLLAVSGIYVPYVEEGILLSVLIFGGLVAFAFKLHLVASASLVGIFAIIRTRNTLMNKYLQFFLLIAGATFLLPISAFAHTGIGETMGFSLGFSHPIGGVDHLLAMMAVGLWAAQMSRKAQWIVPSAFLILMIFGSLLAVSGIYVPYVEEGILLSVLIFGGLIAFTFKLPLVASASLVGIFAIFHGYAHGAELPLAIGAVSYSFGFVLGTTLLHVLGLVIGIVLKKMNIEKTIRLIGGAIASGGLYLAVIT